MLQSISQFIQTIPQKMAGLMGFHPYGPLGEVTRNAPPVPAAIETFRRTATTPGPLQDWMMGELRDKGMNPYDFGKFCAAFAEGTDYIYRKYGTSPAGIVITDMPGNQTTFYNFESQTIYVSRQWIGRAMDRYLAAQEKTDPTVLTPLQMAVMYGVEEAYHHYQYTQHGQYYMPMMENYRTPSQDINAYRAHPLEADAKIEVQEAMKAYGFVRMPAAPSQDATWQAKLAERQAQSQLQPQTSPTRA